MTKEEAISIISGYEAYGCGYCLQGDEEVEEALRLAVDALRQETVIRCKDCKFWDSDHIGTGLMLCHISDWNTLVRSADDFCSRAERREE